MTTKTKSLLFVLIVALAITACSGGGSVAFPGNDLTPTPTTNVSAPATAMPTNVSAPATAMPTNVSAAPATAMPAATRIPERATLSCNGNTIVVPEGGQVFPATVWVNNAPQHDPCYDVVYDPDQSGVSYLPAMGWWYQPLLPGPHRDYHEVALILQAGTYKFVGPECTVYHNYDGQHGLDTGNILVNRQNVEELTVPKTDGAPGNESYVFVTCNESDAGGFSFALR